MYVLSAIDWNEIQDLCKHGLKTFELVSADHVETAQKLKPKDKVFIANVSKQDLRKGVEGVIGEVKSVKVDYWRVSPREFDEKEVLAARIQLAYVDHGHMTKVQDLGQGCGAKAEVSKHVLLG